MIDAAKKRRWDQSACVIQQLAYLLRRFYVAAEEDDTAGLYLFDQLARFRIDFGARESD